MSFAQGDTVVHPQHGAAIVERIVSRNGGAGPEEYVELQALSPHLTILIPARSLDEVGVRNLSTRNEAEATLDILRAPSDIPEEWSERNAFTIARMKSTDLHERAMVVRDLTRHAQRTGKPLNAGENRALDSCLEMVSRELALALGMSEEETRARIVEASLVPEEAPEHAT